MTHKVIEAKIWGGNKTQKRDEDGFMMMSLVLEGHENEPVDYKSKSVPSPGATLEGELVEYVSQAGNKRVKLVTAEQKRENNERDRRITASWAIQNALMYCADSTDLNSIEETARAYMHLVDKLTKE